MKSFNYGILIAILITLVYAQACSRRCFECDPTTNACSACIEAYSLTIMADCVKNSIANCNLYLNSTYCLRCSPTYFIQNNTCVKDWSGCYKNITKNKCGTCSPELILNNGTCFGVLNCQKYADNFACMLCDTGYTLVGNVCLANEDNCQIVSRSNGVCISCQPNYTLVGYKCISIEYYNPNCQIYDASGRCLICKDGYILSQANCYGKNQIQLIQDLNSKYTTGSTTIASNIASSNPPKTAPVNQINTHPQPTNSSPQPTTIINQASSNGPSISSNAPPKITPQTTYCKTYQNNICIECYSNFHLQFGICKVNNPLCREIYANGSCRSCYIGYALEAETCILPPVNLTQNIAAINQVNEALQQNNDPNCLHFNSSKCLQCINGYYLNNNNVCSPFRANCLRNDLSTGDCLVCLSPYILMNNDCIYPTVNCLLYSTNNNCYQCQQGYYLQENTCYPNDITCAAYDIIGRCTKCVDTYYLINNVCVYPAFGYDPYCIQYADSYCSSCLLGYFLQNYRCTRLNPSCLQFDYVNGVCLSCGNGLTVSSYTCI